MRWRKGKWGRYRHRVAALFLAGGVLSGSANAKQDNWNVEGANGTLMVHGLLTEGACNLDMESSWQRVSVGDITTSQLVHPGDRGQPVIFKVFLRGCIHMQSDDIDSRNYRHIWDPDQPVITLSFDGVHAPESNELLEVVGMQGIGLRISDVRSNNLELGHGGVPQFLDIGDNELEFTVTPERTSAPLIPGYFQASINFRLDYD